MSVVPVFAIVDFPQNPVSLCPFSLLLNATIDCCIAKNISWSYKEAKTTIPKIHKMQDRTKSRSSNCGVWGISRSWFTGRAENTMVITSLLTYYTAEINIVEFTN